MISLLADIGAWLFVMLTVPGTIYLGILTLASFCRPRTIADGVLEGRIAVVIPAHNEAEGIARTVRNLQALAARDGAAEVVVVADNCDDDTAAIAETLGARVLVRHCDELRGKGHALHFAFSRLLQEQFVAFVVIDADSVAAPNLLQVLRQYFAAGAMAVQTRYTVLNADASSRTRLAELALLGFNVLRPMGRDHLGLSAGILGNGFALRRELLERIPYTASSVVEDLEYHLRLVAAGERVWFAADTVIRGEMPTGSVGSRNQRARWEGGRLRMLREQGPGLLVAACKGAHRQLEALAELLLLPLGYHVMLLATMSLLPAELPRLLGLLGLLVVLMHVLMAARLGNIPFTRLVSMGCSVPGYLLWKICMLPKTLAASGARSTWIRTQRNALIKEGE